MKAQGKALVTGASRGIGRQVALELAHVGFDVVAAMRDPDDGEGIEAELGEARGTVTVARLDVNDSSTIEIPTGLRVLVNNAGIEPGYLPLEHAPLDDWRTVFETNVFGTVEVTKRAIPEIRQSGSGVICNLTSSSLVVPTPFYTIYRASKAAVSAFGESLSAEVRRFGIRVLEVMPGPIDTDMLASSDRLPEGAQFPGYASLAEDMLEGRRSIADMVTSTTDAAKAITDAILDDESPLKVGCDPLGRELLEAWTSNPLQFFKVFGRS